MMRYFVVVVVVGKGGEVRESDLSKCKGAVNLINLNILDKPVKTLWREGRKTKKNIYTLLLSTQNPFTLLTKQTTYILSLWGEYLYFKESLDKAFTGSCY